MEYMDENNLDELFEDSDDTTTEDETSLLHKIIQLRETSTNDYLYPITLIDAVKDINGIGINKIMNDKLIALQEILNDRIEETDQDVSLLRSSKVSAKESLLSSLAVYYLRGVSQLDLSPLYGSNLAKIYLSENQPSISDSDPHYWIDSTERSNIKYYDGTSYISVGQDTEVFIYSTLSDYLSKNGSITLYTSTSYPMASSIYDTGDVYLYIGDESTIPYMYISNRWVSMITSLFSSMSTLLVDPIINLVSIRYLTVFYSSTSPSSIYDIWYDGEKAYLHNVSTDEFEDPVSYSLDKFIGSIFRNRNVGSTSKIFIGPATPHDNTSRYDVWINNRSSSIYVNNSASNVPRWAEQITYTDSVSIGNIFTASDTLDDNRYVDYDSNTPIVGESSSLSIRNLYSRLLSANTSITQIVYVMSNTLYTISVDADHEVDIALDDGEVLESGSVASPYTGYTRYYKTVYFNTGISSNTARVVVGPSDTRVATLCMKRGSSHEWVPNLSDMYLLMTNLLNNKIATSNIYIGSSSSSNSYNIDTNLSYETIRMYYNSTWNDIDDVPDIVSALQEVASIYDGIGVCKITTSHLSPNEPTIGDIWINDNLIAMRWIGSSWGNTSGIMMSNYRTLYGTVHELSDTQLKLAFAQTSQEIDDIVDQASLINQNIQVFKQDDIPTGIINAGDLWVTQTGVKRLYRYNGSEWTLSGVTRLMDIEADASGLNITIGGTTGTIGSIIGDQVLSPDNPNSLISRVATLDMSIEEIALTVSDNLSDIGIITSRFSWEGLGLRVSSILSSGESKVLTDVNSMYIHLRYSAVGTSNIGDQIIYGMSDRPTSRSQSLGIALTSTDQAPTNRDSYTWVALSGDIGPISVHVDNIGTEYQIYRRYSNDPNGADPTYQASSTTYIGLKIGESGTEYWLQYRDVSSPISTYYTSDGIHFMKRDITEVDVGSVTSDGFRLKNGIIEDGGFLRMGNYLWRPMVDKSLSFLYSPESSN